MQTPGYNSGSVVLLEGKCLPFRIYNLVQLQDQEWYYILQDINGLKHFIPAECYRNYGFTTGEDIICKIEKINCTGRLFLEPKHPFYNEGEIHEFKIKDYLNNFNVKKVVVCDIFGNNVEIVLSDDSILGLNGEKVISCRVKIIKKGIPILEIYDNNF